MRKLEVGMESSEVEIEKVKFANSKLEQKKTQLCLHPTQITRYIFAPGTARCRSSRTLPQEHGAAAHVRAAIGGGDRGALCGNDSAGQDHAHARGRGFQEPCEGEVGPGGS